MPMLSTISRQACRRRPWISLAASSAFRPSTSCVAATVAPDKERRRMLSGSSSSSGSRKGGSSGGKQHAMQRQRERMLPHQFPTTTATSGTSKPSSSPSSPPRQSPPPGGFHAKLSPPPQHSFLDTDRGGSLARLNIQPNLKKYYVDDDAEASNSLILPPTWESNKTMTMMSMAGGGSNDRGLRLRDGSSILSNSDDDEGGQRLLLEIDRESLFDPKLHLPHAPQDWKGYEAATPLSDYLMQRIGVSGRPITTAEYMRHALTHPLHGYYTSRSAGRGSVATQDGDDDDDWDWDAGGSGTSNGDASGGQSRTPSAGPNVPIFGPSGDFVTAPELSSVFGHCLCVWFMTQWQALHRPARIQLVELGPGRGTLMADVLELAHSSKLADFGRSVASVHLIEASRPLRLEQRATLKRALGHLVELVFADGDGGNNNDGKGRETTANPDAPVDEMSATKRPTNTLRVEWHDDFASFQKARDRELPTMIVLQEFLDALPVHQFQQTEEGWRERMIDVVSAEEEEADRKAMEAIAAATGGKGDASPKRQPLIPRLRQVLAPQATPAVELLLSSNEQYSAFPEGTVVEICPDALILVEDIVTVLKESKGAGLIIDYGEEGTSDTLRAFSRHQQVPLTSRPGQVDVTADVDFFALKNCVATVRTPAEGGGGSATGGTASPPEIHAFGPVPQGEFLMRMGAADLAMNAIERDETTEEQAQAIADALKYLVLPEHMGTKFKVLALARKRDGLFAPPGME